MKTRQILTLALALVGLLACDNTVPATDSGVGPTDAGDEDAGPTTDAGPMGPDASTDAGPTGLDAGPMMMDAGSDASVGVDSGTLDAGPPTALVDVTIRGSVLLGNNYPQQLHPLFRASFTSSSGMGRLQLFARFCRDAACDDPIALVPAQVAGASSEGLYVFSTASVTGGGFDKEFIIPQAPAGASFMQLIGDTERSRLYGRGTCTGIGDCPSDVDVLQMTGFNIEGNVSGGDFNPSAASTPVTVTEGGTIDLTDVLYLGHVVFSTDLVAGNPSPTDRGTLLAAMSNRASTFRNFMAHISLTDASNNAGAVLPASYELQQSGAAYAGDVCGIVRGDTSMFAIGINIEGASIFRLNNDGSQASDSPIVTIPPTMAGDPTTLSYPCRGVWQRSSDGSEHLYLNQFRGAGSNDTSSPHPIVHVNVTASRFATPFDASLGEHAIRALVLRGDGNLVGVDMSWSRDASNRGVTVNRLIPISVNATNGALGSVGAAVLTTVRSDETCGSTANYPTGAAVLPIGGTPRLLVGWDQGVEVYDPTTLRRVSGLDLLDFGQLFSQFAPSLDGTRIYALPNCKTIGSRSRFRLPAGAGTENSDTNLVAVLDATGATLAVASTTIDIDGDGSLDHGIDMDFYRLKAYIREFSSTLPIPPVVYTAPRLAVGEAMLFVRGSGAQFGGSASSGLGQVQDLGFFDLATGHGGVFGGYVPWFHGLSSGAGTGTGIWGYDVYPGSEASVGALVYIPGS